MKVKLDPVPSVVEVVGVVMNNNTKNQSFKQQLYDFIPWVLFITGLLFTALVWHEERTHEIESKYIQIQQSLENKVNRFKEQTFRIEEMLFGLRSFLYASDSVSEKEFRHYLDTFFGGTNVSEIEQFGFAKLQHAMSVPLPKVQHASSEFNHLSQPDLYAPVIFQMAKNKAQTLPSLRGYNLFENDVLKSYLLKAADHDEAWVAPYVSISAPENEMFSIVLPVYDRNATLERYVVDRNHLLGWVFVNLDFKVMVADLIAETAGSLPVRYAVYRLDKSQSTESRSEVSEAYLSPDRIRSDALLMESRQSNGYDSDFNVQKVVKVYGKEWIFAANSMPKFDAMVDYAHSNWLALLGIALSLTLMSLAQLLVSRLKTSNALVEVNDRLQVSEERWQFALEGSEMGVFDCDLKNGHIEVSPRWLEIFGYGQTNKFWSLRKFESRIHPEDVTLCRSKFHSHLKGEEAHFFVEYRMICASGDWKWVQSKGMVVSRDEAGVPLRLVGTSLDITERKMSEQKVWHQANYDQLTDLPNRSMLREMVVGSIKKAQQASSVVAILCLDLDGFKEINDSLGHAKGDSLLKLVAARLEQFVNDECKVSRQGGDEFVMLLSTLKNDKTLIDSFAQTILDCLSEQFDLGGDQAYISGSIGISIAPDDAEDVDMLIQNADQAMYASKKRGGNTYSYFDKDMKALAMRRMRLMTDMRDAISNKELFVEYQPIIELHTGHTFKAEALLRWKHPELGLISPFEFIPIAEDSKLINEIGNWVFMQSINQVNVWRELFDPRFQIAVNKSPVQFMSEEPKHHDWYHYVSVDDVHGSPIVVEITESLLMENAGLAARRLKYLKERGFKLALDDFGTGYSSLSYLRDFDIDYLKIDRSFVSRINDRREDQMLCIAMIEMAHAFNLKVVAEGIETKEQLEVLLAAGCDYGQGYYFAKPLGQAAFEDYLKQSTSPKKQSVTIVEETEASIS